MHGICQGGRGASEREEEKEKEEKDCQKKEERTKQRRAKRGERGDIGSSASLLPSRVESRDTPRLISIPSLPLYFQSNYREVKKRHGGG